MTIFPNTTLKSQAHALLDPLDEVDRDNLRYGRITRQVMARAIKSIPNFDPANWFDVLSLTEVLNEYLAAGKKLNEVSA